MRDQTKVSENTDRPDIVALPPVIFGVAAVAGLLLEYSWRRPLLSPQWRLAALSAGVVLVLMFLALAIAAERAMHRAGTNVLPTRPSTTIVSTGPFLFTRNPIYLGVILGYVGGALLLNLSWPLVTLIPAAGILHCGVVLREEAYLEAKFGDQYRAYKSTVRRWI